MIPTGRIIFKEKTERNQLGRPNERRSQRPAGELAGARRGGVCMRRVAMASVAQSSGIESKDTLMDFTFWVAREPLAKAGLSRDELGCVIIGSSDIFHSGLSCANSFDWDGTGAFMKDGSRAEESIFAFIYGCMRIMSGEFETVLVTSLV